MSNSQNRRPKDVKGPTSSQQAQNFLLQRAGNSENANSLLNAFSKFKSGAMKEEEDDASVNQDVCMHYILMFNLIFYDYCSFKVQTSKHF